MSPINYITSSIIVEMNSFYFIKMSNFDENCKNRGNILRIILIFSD